MSSSQPPGDKHPAPPGVVLGRPAAAPAAASDAPAAPPAFARGTLNEPFPVTPGPGDAPIPIDAPITIDAPREELRALEDKLGRCLSGLTLHFQPIVHARTRARFGYEALLRSSDRALPHPGAVLDAAERLERIPAIGRAVRAHAARVIAEAPPERGLVFVNLHLLDLFDKQLTSAFAPLTKVASRVVLEITERSSVEGQADLRYRVAELRELGFRIAIDDLGGGHARMGTFSLLDCDFVKLDMSLVRDIERHPIKQRLIASVADLCRAQGITVIGEGVETEAEERVLVDLGCDLLQGYLIARPGPAFVDPL